MGNISHSLQAPTSRAMSLDADSIMLMSSALILLLAVAILATAFPYDGTSAQLVPSLFGA